MFYVSFSPSSTSFTSHVPSPLFHLLVTHTSDLLIACFVYFSLHIWAPHPTNIISRSKNFPPNLYFFSSTDLNFETGAEKAVTRAQGWAA